MTHYTMGDILQADDGSAGATTTDGGDDETAVGVGEKGERKEKEKGEESTPPPTLATYILSASVSGNDGRVKLPKPIAFTMRHIKVLIL